MRTYLWIDELGEIQGVDGLLGGRRACEVDEQRLGVPFRPLQGFCYSSPLVAEPRLVRCVIVLDVDVIGREI